MANTKKTNQKYPTLDFFDKVRESKIIGLPCTPSKWMSTVRKDGKITCMTITCGGGLGGSRWDEFAVGDIRKEIVPNSIITILDTNGHEKQINTNFIVCTIVYDMLEVDLVSTNDRVKFEGVHTLRWIVNVGNTDGFKLSNEYSDFWRD